MNSILEAHIEDETFNMKHTQIWNDGSRATGLPFVEG